MSLFVTALGGIGGSYVESKIKAYKSLPQKGDAELTFKTREELLASRKK
jgi:hypothetical protein